MSCVFQSTIAKPYYTDKRASLWDLILSHRLVENNVSSVSILEIKTRVYVKDKKKQMCYRRRLARDIVLRQG